MSVFSEAPPFCEDKRFRLKRIDALSPISVIQFLGQASNFMSFMNSGSKGNLSAEQLLAYSQEQRLNNQLVLYLAYNAQTHEPVGAILINRAKQKPDQMNLAYYTVPEQRGCGIAPQMVESLLSILFEKTSLESVYCAIWGNNKASLRTLEKAGFQYIGYLPSYIDLPPVLDHQFLMTRGEFVSPKRRPTQVHLASEN
jgi:RimJ/RimL family protein N-acetyltransferase